MYDLVFIWYDIQTAANTDSVFFSVTVWHKKDQEYAL